MRRIESSAREALSPRPHLPISEIAEQHLFLSREYSKEPGPIRLARTPFLREPMDRLSPDSPTLTVVFMGPVQIGKTVIGQAFITAIITHYPGPILFVTDTDWKAEEFSKYRLDPMVRDSPALRSRVAEPKSRSRDNTIRMKSFPGGYLKLVGAQSASGLTSTTIRYAVIDEVDDHAANVSYSGSSVALAMARQTTYGDMRKTLIVSSPKIKGESDIEAWYLRGDRRRYWVPCPRCGEFQPLEWRDPETGAFRLVWTKGRPEEARYSCAHCGVLWDEREKASFLPAGEWRPENLTPADPSVASYWINALYSPLGMFSWADMARQWERATARAKVGDLDELRTFINTRLAESFEEPGESVDAGALVARCEDFPAKLPAAVRTITAGVDVQDDRLEVEVVAWGPGLESWSLAYHVVPTDPLDRQTWADLLVILSREWQTEDGRTLRVRATCVDSGYRTQAVYDFARKNASRRIFAVKGLSGSGRPIWSHKVHIGKDKGRFHLVGVDTAKDAVAAYLRIVEPGPGYCHFPTDRARLPDYFAQLTAERRVKVRDRRGRERWEWRLVEGKRNEALDARVYALAAAHALLLGGVRLESPSERTSTAQPLPPPEPSVSTSPIPASRPALPGPGRDPRGPVRPWDSLVRR